MGHHMGVVMVSVQQHDEQKRVVEWRDQNEHVPVDANWNEEELLAGFAYSSLDFVHNPLVPACFRFSLTDW